MPTPSAKAALTSNTGHRRSRTVATLPPATPTRASGLPPRLPGPALVVDHADRGHQRRQRRLAAAAGALPADRREGRRPDADLRRDRGVADQRHRLRAVVLGDRPRRADRPGPPGFAGTGVPVPADGHAGTDHGARAVNILS